MSEIRVIEKPESVSWETIRKVIQQAHQVHFNKGIVMRTTTLSAEEIEERVGKDGKCFVAMDGDKVVGVGACRLKSFKRWFLHGDAMEFTLGAILPSYKGKQIYPMLTKVREEEARRQGIYVLCGDTAEGNTRILKMYSDLGFVYVDFYSFHFSKHYSVEMMKWLHGCPFSGAYCFLRFHLKKLYVKLRYKPGRIKRFGF